MDKVSFMVGFVRGARDLGLPPAVTEELWKQAMQYPPFQEQLLAMPEAPADEQLHPELLDTMSHLQGIHDQQSVLDNVISQNDLSNA
jgi:hypothetical protein